MSSTSHLKQFINQQVSILHPLATLDWEECTPLPENILQPEVVLLHDVLYVGGSFLPTSDKAKLFMCKTVTERFVWDVVSTPASHYSLTTYHSQLVLVGGMEILYGYPSDMLWTLSNDAGLQWQLSIQEMPTERWSASAVNTGTPEYIVVAGGIGTNFCNMDTVEVFTGEQWCTVEPLPLADDYLRWSSHEGVFYLRCGSDNGCTVFSFDLKLLLKSCEQSDDEIPLPLWTEFQSPLTLSSLTYFGKHLISFGVYSDDEFSPDIVALSPYSQSWVHVGELPSALEDVASVILPTGELFVIGVRPTRVFKTTLRGEGVLYSQK